MTSLLKRIDQELNMRINYHQDLPNKSDFITLVNLLSVEEKVFEIYFLFET